MKITKNSWSSVAPTQISEKALWNEIVKFWKTDYGGQSQCSGDFDGENNGSFGYLYNNKSTTTTTKFEFTKSFPISGKDVTVTLEEALQNLWRWNGQRQRRRRNLLDTLIGDEIIVCFVWNLTTLINSDWLYQNLNVFIKGATPFVSH